MAREIFLQIAVAAAVFLAMSTELLSAFHALTPVWAGALWVMFLGVVLLFLRSMFKHLKVAWPQERYVALILGALCAMALALFVQGFFSAPNTFDAMTYHLSRVMHWVQGRNVAFYPTAIERQLWMPPLAEYGILHLYFLTGSDRLAFLPQWAAYVGSVVAASLVARNLGGGRIVQVVAAALCASVPVAVLQAVSTQSDLFATFWLMNALVWLTAWLRDGYDQKNALLFAASTALAILAKTTMAIFVLPFVVMAVIMAWYVCQKRAAGLLVVAAAFFVAALSGPHVTRTIQCFGTFPPRGDIKELRLTNEALTPPGAVSLLLKGAALELAMPCNRINNALQHVLARAHARMGIAMDDRRFNFEPGVEMPRKGHCFYEARASNPLHFLSGVVALLLLLLWRRRFAPPVFWYGACVAVGYFLVTLLVKWQPWMTRFHMTALMLSAPLIALVLMQIDRTGRLLKMAAILFILIAIPSMMFNVSHPWTGKNAFYRLPRIEQYFIGAAKERAFFMTAVNSIRAQGCAQVGLALSGEDVWEYPLWPLLAAQGPLPEIRHVHVRGASSVYEDKGWRPCVMISDKE